MNQPGKRVGILSRRILKQASHKLCKLMVHRLHTIAQHVHHTCVFEYTDSATGKKLGGSSGKDRWKLKHQVGTAQKRHTCALVFVDDGRLTSLHEITAHYYDDIISRCLPFNLLQLIFVPIVEWIVFGNHTCNLHV